MASNILIPAFGITSSDMKLVLEELVDNRLASIDAFSIEKSKEWSQLIGNEVKEKCKELSVDPNYKCWVSVVIGELKGQGVECSSYCAWDANTDNTISCWYANDVLYWFVIAFIVYSSANVEDKKI